MNTKQQNTLRSLLKKYKFKSVSNVVRQALGINFENFLQKTEPLYVIPRIASCYTEEQDKAKLNGIIYKEWLKDVVEKAWVAPLNEYIEEHGERIVLSAIYYLIDNGLWESYEGRLSLDAQEDNYYDKLEDMPSAIAMVQEQQAEEKKAEQKKAEEEAKKAAAQQQAQQQPSAENRPPLAPVPSDSIAGQKSGYTLTAEEATALIAATSDTCVHLKQNIERLFDFVHTATDTDALRQEIAALQQQLEAQKAAHQKEVTVLQQKADEANATMLKASDYIAKQKQQAKEAQKQYDELNAKYKKALDERDDADKELETYKKLLEEEANREQLPKKKVIPYSVLDAVPLLGKGVMTGLEPVLAKYNIIIDHNK
nr:MAG TPA: Keratin, type II cytoskeletal 1 filament, cytoskeleton, skin, coiled-coil [Caudoviricetes sp.]